MAFIFNVFPSRVFTMRLFVLTSKIIFNKSTFSLMYYNNFVFKIVGKILLFPLLLRNLIVIWALNDLMLPNNKLSFITNNVKEIQSLKKRLKLIQYFKSKIGPCGLLFLQETQSNSKVEQKWKEDFHGKVSLSHGKTKFSRCPNCIEKLNWKIYL